MSDHLEGLAEWVRKCAAMPKPVSYIVLDPMHMGPHKDEVDGVGRRYLVVSPGVLDGVRHMKDREGPPSVAALGIDVYRWEDMAADWPGYGVDHAPETRPSDR